MLIENIHENKNCGFTYCIFSFAQSNISDSWASNLSIGLLLHKCLSLLFPSDHEELETYKINSLPNWLPGSFCQ